MHATEVFKKTRTLITNELRVYALYLGSLNCNHVFGPRTVYHWNKLRAFSYSLVSLQSNEMVKKTSTLITNKPIAYSLYLGPFNFHHIFGPMTIFH